jgi:hypothetical protein
MMRPELAAKIRTDMPHSARVWNYWLGGKHLRVFRRCADPGREHA